MMLGGVDPVAGALTGPARYTPMTTPGDASSQYYTVTLDDAQLGERLARLRSIRFSGAAAVDTGTSTSSRYQAPCSAR